VVLKLRCNTSIWKGLVLLVGLAGLPAEHALALQEQEHPGLAERLAAAVVAIEGRTASGERCYGAGVVVSPDGLILSSLTAVPQQVKAVQVTWADGSSSRATIIFSVVQTETVLLQVQRSSLPYLCVGSAGSVEVGAPVLAAGNPHETLRRDGQVFVSSGSLTGRYVATSEDRASRYRGEVLETDAAVNPGCDGGALVDAHGRLIGVLSLCYTRARWMGTAIPIERILTALPPEERERLSHRGGQDGAPEGLSSLLRQAATPTSAALVRLEFHREPEAEWASEKSSAPRAATVSQDAGESTLARRPETDATGLSIEPRGTVLTSALNLEGVRGPVTVVLPDGRRYRARIRGRHVDLDLAVLKIEGMKKGDPWPVATLVPTAGLRAGSFIGITGAPPQTSTEPTFTTGIVSASSRFGGLAVQVDAKTNYGNAGGPVTDLRGRCLGIVTQVGTRKCWGQSSGVGFFAPAEKILSVLDELLDGKTLRVPGQTSLGVLPAIGENDREGVKIGVVGRNTPASRAGLREGDLATAADGQPVRSWSGLVRILNAHRPGSEVRLQILRGAEVIVVPVVLRGEE
jgi:S1-C subfamily serine protease